MASPEEHRGEGAFLEHYEDPFNTDLERARRIADLINSLTTDLPNGGWLYHLVWNMRNNYLGNPGGIFTAEEMQMVCEGFLAEVEYLRSQIPGEEVSDT